MIYNLKEIYTMNESTNDNKPVVEINNSKCKKVLEFHQFNWMIKLKIFPEIIDGTHY